MSENLTDLVGSALVGFFGWHSAVVRAVHFPVRCIFPHPLAVSSVCVDHGLVVVCFGGSVSVVVSCCIPVPLTAMV